MTWRWTVRAIKYTFGFTTVKREKSLEKLSKVRQIEFITIIVQNLIYYVPTRYVVIY